VKSINFLFLDLLKNGKGQFAFINAPYKVDLCGSGFIVTGGNDRSQTLYL